METGPARPVTDDSSSGRKMTAPPRECNVRHRAPTGPIGRMLGLTWTPLR